MNPFATCTLCDFIFWPPEVSKFCRSQPPWSSEVKKGISKWNRNTKYPMIWYLTWLIFIDLISWPPEISKFWRSRPPGPSEVKKEYQNGLRTQINLQLDTPQDLFSLIKYVDHFWRSLHGKFQPSSLMIRTKRKQFYVTKCRIWPPPLYIFRIIVILY